MNPVLVISGSFLFWISARKRFKLYADLAKQGNGATMPVVSPGGSQGGSPTDNAPSVAGAADALGDVVNDIWRGIRI